MSLPKWVAEAIRLRHRDSKVKTDWKPESDTRISRLVHMAYPSDAMVYFVVEALNPGHPDARPDGWRTLEGTHFVKQTAISSAQKKAYYDQVPHRVREEVWNG